MDASGTRALSPCESLSSGPEILTVFLLDLLATPPRHQFLWPPHPLTPHAPPNLVSAEVKRFVPHLAHLTLFLLWGIFFYKIWNNLNLYILGGSFGWKLWPNYSTYILTICSDYWVNLMVPVCEAAAWWDVLEGIQSPLGCYWLRCKSQTSVWVLIAISILHQE